MLESKLRAKQREKNLRATLNPASGNAPASALCERDLAEIDADADADAGVRTQEEQTTDVLCARSSKVQSADSANAFLISARQETTEKEDFLVPLVRIISFLGFPLVIRFKSLLHFNILITSAFIKLIQPFSKFTLQTSEKPH